MNATNKYIAEEDASLVFTQLVMNKICHNCTREAEPDRKSCKGCLASYRKSDIKRRGKLKYKIQRKIWNAKESDQRKLKKYGVKSLDEIDDYITVVYIMGLWIDRKTCYYCNVPMQYQHCQEHNGMTIERLDNEKPHTRENCRLACSRCNCRHNNNKKFFCHKSTQCNIICILPSLL